MGWVGVEYRQQEGQQKETKMKYKNLSTGATCTVNPTYPGGPEEVHFCGYDGERFSSFASSRERIEWMRTHGFKTFNRFTKKWQ